MIAGPGAQQRSKLEQTDERARSARRQGTLPRRITNLALHLHFGAANDAHAELSSCLPHKDTAQMIQLNTQMPVSASMPSPTYTYAVVSPGSEDYADYCALRHEVFCEELGRVSASTQSCTGERIETDAFDIQSVHVLCRSVETGAAIACVRLILPGPRGLNVLSRYMLDAQDGDEAAHRSGEIGRLALSSLLRRYRHGTPGQASSGGATWPKKPPSLAKNDGPAVALGLYREIFRLAHAYGITHCYAAMEPALARHLTRQGFPFEPAGPLNQDVQPMRRPYRVSAYAISQSMCSLQGGFAHDSANGGPSTACSNAPPAAAGAWRSVSHSGIREAQQLRA